MGGGYDTSDKVIKFLRYVFYVFLRWKRAKLRAVGGSSKAGFFDVKKNPRDIIVFG